MRARTLPAIAVALLATAVLGGCGPTLFDAKGVPVVTPTCTDAALPIACLGADACVAEDDSHCGTSCLDCTANALNNATSFCDRTSLDLSQHACATSCTPGFVHDPNGPGCICDVGETQCAGSTACIAQDKQHCGASCVSCPDVPNGTGKCDTVAGACDFVCNTPVYERSGSQCVCASGTVACGAGGACVTESATACGSQCLSCPLPANGGTPLCTTHACDWSCPQALPVKCGTAAAPDCCQAPACTPQQNQCPTATGPQCFANDDVNHCGQLCSDCQVTPVPNPLPANAIAACLPNGADFGCGFVCPAGFFKTSAGCERAGSGPADVAVGGKHTCLITDTSRTVKCWGANDQGQIGDGTSGTPATPTSADRLAPVDVVGLPAGARAHAIAAGQAHSCVLLDDAAHVGEIWCWGANASGQLGGTPVAAGFPVRVLGITGSTLSTLVPIAAGASHTCAINSAGGVSCWGANNVGQLGNGSNVPSSAPLVAIPAPSTAIALASGFDHTCALVGTAVKCWGANASGQVGNGVANAAGENVPRDVAGLGGAVNAIAAGEAHSCAALVNGGTQCWGSNANWQLALKANGVPAISLTPTLAADSWFARQATLVSAGKAHSCGGKPGDPAPKCQGDIGTGIAPAVGVTGTAVDVAQVGAEVLVRLFSGGDHNCEVLQPTAGGTGPFDLWCWGVNDRGQLGTGGTSAVVAAPTRVQPQ
jgi:alpha-tubulin suppressor-like RCC1 family protein